MEFKAQNESTGHTDSVLVMAKKDSQPFPYLMLTNGFSKGNSPPPHFPVKVWEILGDL